MSQSSGQMAAQTEPAPAGLGRALGRVLANSFLFARGKRLMERNFKDWNLPMSKADKLLAGGYLILRDYGAGRFPPRYEERDRAYQAERDYHENLPGVNLDENLRGQIRKPFWGGSNYAKYGRDFGRLLSLLEGFGLQEGSRLLELGCGTGWMCEFLVLSGYTVVGTSIAPTDIGQANKRLESLRVKGFDGRLSFRVLPMESADEVLKGGGGLFDGVFVYEALHHAFNWREAIAASYRCLRPGGWLILASEPNVMHTFIAYRTSRLSNTHEIGLSKRRLVGAMREAGFQRIRVVRPRFNDRISYHWIAAQK